MEDQTPVRCVCAAALERARSAYGHLEGEKVSITKKNLPDTTYVGTLQFLTNHPGYVWVERGDEDHSKLVHIDNVLSLRLYTGRLSGRTS